MIPALMFMSGSSTTALFLLHGEDQIGARVTAAIIAIGAAFAASVMAANGVT